MQGEIVELALYWYDKRKWKSPTEHGVRNKVVIIPSGPTAIQMKHDVAEVLSKIIKNVYQYYIVAKRENAKGVYTFRTVVPMVLIADKRRTKILRKLKKNEPET